MGTQSYKEWRKKTLLSARDKKAFVGGHFELTGRCNLDCKMCYVHTLDHNAAREKELSTEQWKKIFDEAYDCGMLFANLTGGECLLHPDFKELYLYLWKKRIMVGVLTNGTLLTDDYVAFFKQYRPDYIQISLYGSSEEGYLQVAGHKGFEKAMAAIRALRDAKIDVQVAVTPNRYLKEDYIPLLKLCKDNGFVLRQTEMILTQNRENPDKDDFYLSEDEIVSLFVQRAELHNNLQPETEAPEPRGSETSPQKGLPCTAGNCVCTVTWDGKMHPCVTALTEGADVRELGFVEAWERTKAAAAEILLPVECIGCPYDKVCVKCPTLRSPKQDGHCDPSICEITRRLVAVGAKSLHMPEPMDSEHGI